MTMTNARDTDGRHDFDFWFGQWHGQTRKIADLTDPDCDRWEELTSTSKAEPILEGLGNMDTIRFEGGRTFEGMTLRLFEPATGLWRIWWASSVFPGRLDEPVVGRFVDGVGTFECDDVLGGHPVRVRYVWSDITATSARWRQYFRWRPDGDFVLNWVIQMTRG